MEGNAYTLYSYSYKSFSKSYAWVNINTKISVTLTHFKVLTFTLISR